MGADVDSIAAVYRRRYVGFAAALATVTGDRESGRDAVQEGFAVALRERSTFRGGSLEAWVWTIALRVALRARQKDGERTLDVDTVDAQVVDRERDPQLTAAIGSLPPRRRLVVFLRYFADLTYADIAAALEVSEGTVAATLAQAREALAAEISREEGR
ncbi:MAG: RNA polymerase sigma factor [Thermoleophilaceae bacterium]